MFSSWIGSKRNNPTGSSCFFLVLGYFVSSYWGGQPQAFKYFCHSLMASCVGLPNNAAKRLVGNGLTGWIGVPALDLSPSRPLDLSTSPLHSMFNEALERPQGNPPQATQIWTIFPTARKISFTFMGEKKGRGCFVVVEKSRSIVALEYDGSQIF